MSLIADKFKKDYDKYLDDFETSDWMDVDAHTRWSLSVGGLIRKIEKLEKEKEEIKVKADILIFQKNIKIQKLEQENNLLTEHCARLEQPIIDKMLGENE